MAGFEQTINQSMTVLLLLFNSCSTEYVRNNPQDHDSHSLTLAHSLSLSLSLSLSRMYRLFRSNTMSVRIIADHIRHIAPVYLVNTLHSVIHRVLEYAKPLEIDSTRTIDGKPVKQSEIRRRLAIIINFAELLLQAIFDSVTDCPKYVLPHMNDGK